MTKLLARMSLVTIVFASLIAVANLAGAAEKQKFTYTKNARQLFAETKVNPGGATGRELAQMMYVDSKITATGWDLAEERHQPGRSNLWKRKTQGCCCRHYEERRYRIPSV